MTNSRIEALEALSVEAELREVEAVFGPRIASKRPSMPIPVGVVKLKRSFNMTMDGVTLKFWRVQCEGHPNNNSDLSFEGLRQWGIIS